MTHKPAGTPLSRMSWDADENRRDIERLESEAQTHDHHRDHRDGTRTVVPSGHQKKETNMKSDVKLLQALNQLLADELTAISQYMVHSEMCDNWGYDKLHNAIEKQAMDEMHHAEWLIRRIIFLEGTPVVAKLNPIEIGRTVQEMVCNDQKAELEAVDSYNAAIRLARDVADQGTADLLGEILKMEEGHADWAERQRSQIEQVGLENYLANQTSGAISD
jgi:bacterioferritin